MKVVVAAMIVILLMVAGYRIRPDIDAAVTEYWLYQIDAMTYRSDMSNRQLHDELLVLSLNLRQADRKELAWQALIEADALMSDQALTKALIGLYSMEFSRAGWFLGATPKAISKGKCHKNDSISDSHQFLLCDPIHWEI